MNTAKFTNESQRQFAKAIAEAIEYLNDDESTMSNPCIYAETGGVNRRDIGFCFGPKTHMQDGDVLWIVVDGDSFGDYDADADPENEAHAIAANIWESAVFDIVDAMEALKVE